ncbi:MAG: BlaI/MecI/CopY family transcriptional regulator [Defluviitaleaceae bacterium]|nr:BlaI/MecI/CopY family transcriptional regulator [Defluviitaleaceae bacterium]MCL2275522.1 BlaI/MecI/CopY family transcriptional regulator [Defluviitaleaceae bacterium]
MRIKKWLGDAELEIMMVLWRSSGEPVTAKYVLENLPKRRAWVLPSLMSSLAKLCEKGFVSCDRTYRLNQYTALVSEEAYKAQEGEKVLNHLYENSLQNFVAALYNKNVIGDTDIEELRQFLDTLEKGEQP